MPRISISLSTVNFEYLGTVYLDVCKKCFLNCQVYPSGASQIPAKAISIAMKEMPSAVNFKLNTNKMPCRKIYCEVCGERIESLQEILDNIGKTFKNI